MAITNDYEECIVLFKKENFSVEDEIRLGRSKRLPTLQNIDTICDMIL